MKHARAEVNYAILTKSQTAFITWKETCIKFIKYAQCRLWANIYEIHWDFRSANIISLLEKTVVETISVATTESSIAECVMSWPVSNKHIYEIVQRKRDVQTLCSSWHFIVYPLLLKIQIYNEDRYEDNNILGTHYFVLLDATLVAL